MPPIILSATSARLEKLDKAPEHVPIRIKIPGSKLEITTVMRNPFCVYMHGDGFDLSKAVKSVGNSIHKVTPAIDKASDIAMLLETVSGQPELAAVGAVGKALATSTTALMGGSGKNAVIVINRPSLIPWGTSRRPNVNWMPSVKDYSRIGAVSLRTETPCPPQATI